MLPQAAEPEPTLVRTLRALGWGLARVFSILALAAAWELFARSGAVTPFMLPKLSAVLERIWSDLISGDLLINTGVTVYRAMVGFLIAAAAGTLIGMAMSRRQLANWFFDPILSRDGKISCASCHDPKYGFADPSASSEGFRGLRGTRNAMSVLNAAYHFTQFWDGRAATLEAQAEGPVQNPIEMAHTLPGVERKLSADLKYAKLFEAAWGVGAITYEMVAKSLASYERTLLSGNSPFDRYQYGGDTTAMSASAIRGLDLFQNLSFIGQGRRRLVRLLSGIWAGEGRCHQGAGWGGFGEGACPFRRALNFQSHG